MLAVVAAGLFTGWKADQALLAETRVKVRTFWSALGFVLDSALFVLVGLQVPVILDALAPRSLGHLVLPALAVAVAVMALRMGFVIVLSAIRRYTPRVDAPLSPGEQLVVGWSGMRGAVSLAAALAVPLTTEAGEPLAGPDLVLLVTFVTILSTIAVQGLTLPLLVRRLGLGHAAEQERREREARLEAAHAALERLDRVAVEGEAPETTVERLRTTYNEHAERAAREPGDEPETEDSSEAYRELRAITLAAERDAILRLRREGRLSAEAAQRLRNEVDLAESHLQG